MKIRPATGEDLPAWRLLRRKLWPTCSDRKHTREMRSYLAEEGRFAVFLAERSDGSLSGFVEVSMRPDHRPEINPRIGYLEGLFVDRKDLRQGVARALSQSPVIDRARSLSGRRSRIGRNQIQGDSTLSTGG